MTIGEFFIVIAILAGAVAVVLNTQATKNERRQKRSEYLFKLYRELFSDRVVSRVFYDIVYNRYKFDEMEQGSEVEQGIDKLLGYFDIFSRLYYAGNFNDEDVLYFQYVILVVYRNKEVRRYLVDLEQKVKNQQISIFPYEYIRKLGSHLDEKYGAALIKHLDLKV